MSDEEAKSPRLSRNWEAVDVFIFSNGQERSPPRKYHFSTDQLSSWDSTLNYVARTLYSWRVPTVKMYALDGTRVETPLQLNNGTAYVAVPPHQAFKLAGYDKYLMKANKNIPFNRSWDKRQRKSRCSDCTNLPGNNKNIASVKANNDPAKVNSKVYAHITETVSEAHIVAVISATEAKPAENPTIDAKEVSDIKYEGDTKLNEPIVQHQKITRTLFRRRSLTPTPKNVDFDSKKKTENVPVAGKINTNLPVKTPLWKRSLFKSPTRKSSNPTEKLNETINGNSQKNQISNDLQPDKPLTNGTISEKITPVAKQANYGNSHETINTLKAETSDINKRSSVPNLFYPETTGKNERGNTADFAIPEKQKLEQGTCMSKKCSRMANDALISLNKEEFQTIVDRIVQRILNEKATNEQKETAKPKLVYAKVTQSTKEGDLVYDKNGRVMTLMNDGEIINFKLNIEVANIDDPQSLQPYRRDEPPKSDVPGTSEYTSNSSVPESSKCDDMCECQVIKRLLKCSNGSRKRSSLLQNLQNRNADVAKTDAYSLPSHGDVKDDDKDKSNRRQSLSKDTDTTTSNNTAATGVITNNVQNTEKATQSEAATQTNGLSEILLEAKEHPDGRYTFHLPPLQVLRHYNV